MSERKYIDTADVAKLVRDELKQKFPSVKFSVRSKRYSGGSSIDVSWIDGPTSKQVRAITQHFAGASFDGMVDLKEYHDTEHNGETVHFGADYVFDSREYSREFTQTVAAIVANEYGVDCPVLNQYDWFDYSPDTKPVDSRFGNDSIIDKIRNWREYAIMKNGKVRFVSDYESGYLPDGMEFYNKRNGWADEPEPMPEPTHAEPEAPDISANVDYYKGKPVLNLPTVSGFNFSFGVEKAKTILANLDTIRQFVEQFKAE